MEEDKPEEGVLEKETDMDEETSVLGTEEIDVADQPGGALPMDYMEKRFPEKPDKEHTPIKSPKKSHRLRNYVIAGAILIGGAFAGDTYLQGSTTDISINTNYKPGSGYVQIAGKGLDKGLDLWAATKTKAGDLVRLEERVDAVKGFTKYDQYKPIYQIGGIALLAGAAAYVIGSRMERRKFIKK